MNRATRERIEMYVVASIYVTLIACSYFFNPQWLNLLLIPTAFLFFFWQGNSLWFVRMDDYETENDEYNRLALADYLFSCFPLMLFILLWLKIVGIENVCT